MIRALTWKEYREQSVVWVAVTVVTVLTVGVLVAVLAPQGAAAADSDAVLPLLAATVGLAATYGLVCGAMLLAGEREGGTLPFLDGLPARRGQVWGAKLLAGLSLALLQGLVLAGVAVGFGLPLPSGDVHHPASLSRWNWFWILPAAAAEACAWGLLGSALCRRVLAAVLLAVVLLTVVWVLGTAPPAHGAVILGVVCFRAGLALGALGASLLLFAHLDLERGREPVPAEGPAEEEPVPPRAGRPRGRHAAQALYWLAWRQGRTGILVLGGAAFLAGLVLPTYGPVFWPVATLLTGLLCGCAVYLGEQGGGYNRFLGDQRLPPGRVWGLKSLFWFGVAVAACVLIFTGALQHFAGAGARTGRPEASAAWRVVLPEVLHRNNLLAALSLWLLYGFSVGAICALVWRKTIAALFMAVVFGTALAAAWLPSLVAGGLPAWQVFVVPAVLLALCRLLHWPWVSDRLYTEGPLTLLAAGVLVCLGWVGGCLEYRALGVPDVGQPFDVAAFEASLPAPEQNPAGQQIRQAVAQLPGQQEEARHALLPPPPPGMMGGGGAGMPAPGAGLPGMAAGAAGPAEVFDPAGAIEAVLRGGWRAAPPRLGKWLALVFRGEWANALREGVAQPLGVVEDPRRITPLTPLPSSLPRCQQAARLFTARALQLQAAGDDAAALEHLTVVLALSRQLRHQAVPDSWRTGAEAERTALVGLDHWLERRPRPELIRRALAELDRHERETPPADEAVKADYLVMRTGIETPDLLVRRYQLEDAAVADRATAPLLEAAWQAPWERARVERLLRVVYAGWLRGTESDFAALVEQKHRLLEEHAFSSPVRGLDGWLPPGDTPGDALTRERLASLVGQSWLQDILPDLEALPLAQALSRCDVRGHRLVLALALYQAAKHSPAPDLNALVREGYLTELPRDPFDKQRFRYRVSAGEQIEWDRLAVDPTRTLRAIPAETGVVWSVGPDLQDDGGRSQGLDSPGRQLGWPGSRSLDLIFLVPPPRQ